MKRYIGFLFLFSLSVSLPSFAAKSDLLQNIPLLNIQNLEYLGGFRIPADTLGESGASYANGVITLGKDGRSIYMVGHNNDQAIAEFEIPELVKSLNHKDFNYAKNIQPFAKVLNRPASGNPQKMDRIRGLEYIKGQLYANTYVYYDASGKATHTTMVIKDAANLAKSEIAGYHAYSAKAHAAGWISPIPQIWQESLKGTYITGSSTGHPIVSRWSVGPSAFTFDPLNNDYGDAPPSAIALNKLLDFPLSSPLGYSSGDVSDYLYNKTLKHGMWTHNSIAQYGFIVPGTRTYMAIGANGGVEGGIGYKITQDTGYTCGGPCPFLADDVYNYYWLFDLNDMQKVLAGKMRAEDVLPHAHGELPKIYASDGHNGILGAAFDYDKNILYATLERGDNYGFGWAPTVVAFKIDVAAAPSSPSISSITEVPKD